MDTTSVLNTLQASGLDSTLNNGKYSITGAPVMDYGDIKGSTGLQVSLAEGLQGRKITVTNVVAFRYAFTIRQWRKDLGVQVETVISFPTGASVVVGEIATAFKSAIDAHPELKITATVSTNDLLLSGKAEAPLFSVKLNSLNLAVSDNQVVKSVASISNATPRVATVTAGHDLVTGQKVVIAGTATTVIDGTYRVSVLTPTTFQLDGTTATGLVSGTITSTVVAQQSRGQFTDLVLKGVTGGLSTNSYSTLELEYLSAIGGGNAVQGTSSNKHTAYIKDNDVTNVDYVNLAADIANNLSATLTTGGATDPEAVAVA